MGERVEEGLWAPPTLCDGIGGGGGWPPVECLLPPPPPDPSQLHHLFFPSSSGRHRYPHPLNFPEHLNNHSLNLLHPHPHDPHDLSRDPHNASVVDEAQDSEEEEEDSEEDEVDLSDEEYEVDIALPSCQHNRVHHSSSKEVPSLPSALTEGAPLNSNPISAIPLITGGVEEEEDYDLHQVGGGGQGPLPPSSASGVQGQGPLNGHSVHGKMYVEDRVRFHLKQWTENGFPSFTPCRDKGEGCAVCRLKGQGVIGLPHEVDDLLPQNIDLHKDQDQHRHPVRGVLFTYQDCIIIELYPDSEPIREEKGLEGLEDEMLPPYVPSSSSPVGVVNVGIGLNNDPSSLHIPHCPPKTPTPAEPEQQSWWDEFDSSSRLPLQVQPIQLQPINLNLKPSDQDQGHPQPPHSNLEGHPPPQVHQPQDQHPEPEQISIQIEREPSPPLNVGVGVEPGEEVVQEDWSLKDSSGSTTSSAGGSSTSAKYPCPSCSKSFLLKKYLKEHLAEVHKESNPWRCAKCGAQFADEKRTAKHSCTLSVATLSSSSESARPGAEKPEKELLEEDILEHTNPSQLEEKLENSAPNTAQKRKSQRSTPRVKKKKSTTRPSSSTAQTPTTAQEESLSEEELDYEAQTRRVPPTPKRFRCSICHKGFTVERRLLNHKSIAHKTDRSSQCEKCGKRFARKDKLMRHMYVHSEEKMFACQICDKRFSRRDKLSDHLKSHPSGREEDDVIHRCPLCEKSFLRPDILKQHVKLHRMGNKHQCPECLRFVTGKERLAKHMERHQEAKAQGQQLLCPLCTKYFIQRQSLKAHIKKFHPEAVAQLLELENNAQGGGGCGSGGSPSSSGGTVSDPQPPHHPSNKNNSSKRASFCCPHFGCGQSFSKKGTLKKHILEGHSNGGEDEEEESSSCSISNNSDEGGEEEDVVIPRRSVGVDVPPALIYSSSHHPHPQLLSFEPPPPYILNYPLNYHHPMNPLNYE